MYLIIDIFKNFFTLTPLFILLKEFEKNIREKKKKFRDHKRKIKYFPLLHGTTVFLLASFDSISMESWDSSSIHTYNTRNVHTLRSYILRHSRFLGQPRLFIDHDERGNEKKKEKKKKKAREKRDQAYTQSTSAFIFNDRVVCNT